MHQSEYIKLFSLLVSGLKDGQVISELVNGPSIQHCSRPQQDTRGIKPGITYIHGPKRRIPNSSHGTRKEDVVLVPSVKRLNESWSSKDILNDNKSDL